MSTPDPRTPRVHGLSSALTPPPSALRPPPFFTRLHDFPPPSALRPPPFFAVHQWINALKPNNRARLCKLVQRPRPFQAGHACSASRSPVPKSDLDPASDPGRGGSLHGCPGKRRAISVGVHYHSPRWFHLPGREKLGLSYAHVHLDSLRTAWPPPPHPTLPHEGGGDQKPRLGHSVDGSLAQQKPRPTTRPQRRGNPNFSPVRPRRVTSSDAELEWHGNRLPDRLRRGNGVWAPSWRHGAQRSLKGLGAMTPFPTVEVCVLSSELLLHAEPDVPSRGA